MSSTPGTLHLLCGHIAAGKSTLARTLADAPNTVLLSEDWWLARLYGDEIASITDYLRCSARLREAVGPHVVALLAGGVSVVLDFPANTPALRAWMRALIAESGAAHRLHHLDVPPDVCKARLRARNAGGAHEFAASDAEFDRIARHVVPPADAEGFTVIVHRDEAAALKPSQR